MKRKITTVIASGLLLLNTAFAQTNISRPDMQWWQDAKFGLFLHWGLYSAAGGDWNGHPYKGNEHFMLYERIPWKVYGSTLAPKFNPVKFDADAWVITAKNAGMKYIVITAKHHEGFAMYNSPSSDYNIVKMTPWAKDPMKLLAAACKKESIRLCFYYSLGRDWQDPDVPTDWPEKGGRSNTWDFPDEDKKDFTKYFHRKVLPQIRELLTQYGPIGVLWFDTPELIPKNESKELKELVHSIQPDCIVNNRIGNGYGDYGVLEQSINNKINLHPWESCVTMSGGWGYNKYDTVWKSPDLLVRQLIETVSAGGNYLLNVGPTDGGEILPQAQQRLAAIGKWMNINYEAVYNTKPWKIASEDIAQQGNRGSLQKTNTKNIMADVLNDNTSKDIFPEVRFTCKGDTVFVFAADIKTGNLTLHSFGKTEFKQIKKITLPGSQKQIKWNQEDAALTIDIPKPLIKEINVSVLMIQ